MKMPFPPKKGAVVGQPAAPFAPVKRGPSTAPKPGTSPGVAKAGPRLTPGTPGAPSAIPMPPKGKRLPVKRT